MIVERHTARGWWLEEAGAAAPLAPLDGDVDADVVVVGGGYTGMWSAWHLLALEPGLRVALLEGELCGHGPSGRNGGFCESLWLRIARLRERFGDGPALALAEASSASVRAVGAWCREQGVDAWFRHSGHLLAWASPSQEGAGLDAVEAAAALGAPGEARALGAAEARAVCDSPVFRGGVSIPSYATLQPARLALGLRARLRERGAALYERSRVRRLRAAPGGVVADTGAGRVRARRAVLAAGPAVRGLPALRSRLTVTSSHIVLTEPVPELIGRLGWTGGQGITDGRLLVHYFRTTRDGRVAFGWGGGRLAWGARLHGRVEVDPWMAAAAREHLLRILPALRGARLTHAWGGPVDVSPSHLPLVGSLPGAPVHFAFGYTGNGVGPSQLAGRTLAAMSLDRRDEFTRLAFVEPPRDAWVPPEPLAWLGGSAIRRALVRRERIEEQGRRPDLLTRALCAAPGLLGIHLGR